MGPGRGTYGIESMPKPPAKAKKEAAAARKRLAAIAKILAKTKVPTWDRAYARLRMVLDPKKARVWRTRVWRS